MLNGRCHVCVPGVDDTDRLIEITKMTLIHEKKLLVIAAGAQRRSLHYWGARNITEGFFFFFLVLLRSSSSNNSSTGLSLLSSCNAAGFLWTAIDGQR